MSDTTNATVDLDSLDLSVDDAKPEKRPPFLGQITVDQREPSKGEFGAVAVYHFGVKPLNFSAKGELGSFHNYINIKLGEDGKPSTKGEYGRVTQPIKEKFGAEVKGKQFGKGELLGLVGWWTYEVQSYGTNKATGEEYKGKYPSLILQRAATQEEVDSAGTGVSVTPAAPKYSTEDVDAALKILDGKKPLEYQRGLMQAPISVEMKNAILSGDAATYLVSAGFATQDGAVIRRVAEAVSA